MQDGRPEGKGRLYTFKKECFSGTFRGGLKHGRGEKITRKGMTIDEEWNHGVLVSSSKNVTKSGILMALKNDHEQMVIGDEIEKKGDREEEKIEKLTEKYLQEASGEFPSKLFAGSDHEGPANEFDNFSVVNFREEIREFCKEVRQFSVKAWRTGDVERFLVRFGFGGFAAIFRENKMDGVALLKLREQDFEDVGILIYLPYRPSKVGVHSPVFRLGPPQFRLDDREDLLRLRFARLPQQTSYIYYVTFDE